MYEVEQTTFNGKVKETPLNNRIVTVIPAKIDFLHSKDYKYELSINIFGILIRNEITQKNNIRESIYRLYHYDQYDNTIEFIPEKKLKKLASYLNSSKERTAVFHYFKIKNEKYTE